MPQIITDLAYILIIAGIVTIVFKRLNQPLVLGYIVAGFLAGPHMPYTPSVSDVNSIEEWSQIGVIFLMFTLGLEFSFKRIIKMGIGPIVAAVCVMLCMIGVGSSVGFLFGWSNMDRLFLGGMLAMSSTTIIYKAFEDLGFRTRKFTSGVLSVLILEDILGILLMVILSALAVSRSLEGTQLISSLLKLGFFLLLWFVVGIYVVPLFLRRFSKYINSETLLIVSVGLCFLLVFIAVKVGYSSAFGAFMMGSILSETIEAERIEQNVSSLKDLFGAIFFVSVGMLVDPSILAQYWLSILVITCAVIFGQMIFGTFSFVVSGHTLKESMQSGFSLAQIGEFAFIIAALGQRLEVTSNFLYPVVVAVSIITTFFTPYMIRAAEPTYKYFENKIFFKNIEKIQLQHGKKSLSTSPLSSAWKKLLKEIFIQTAVYVTICIAIITFSFTSLLPLCRQIFTHWPGNAICGVITLFLVSPNVRPIVLRKNNSEEVKFISKSNKSQKLLISILLFFKFIIGCSIVYYILNFLSPYWWVWHCIASVLIVIFFMINSKIKSISCRMEKTFSQNLRSREEQNETSYGRRLRGKDLHICSLTLPMNSLWGGKTLSTLNFGKNENIIIAAIVRGSTRINVPNGNTQLYPGDTLEVVSDDEGIIAFGDRMKSEVLGSNDLQLATQLNLECFSIGEYSPLCNKKLSECNIRQQHHCTVIGFEDKDGNIQMAKSDRCIQSGDLLWIVGEEADLSILKMGI